MADSKDTNTAPAKSKKLAAKRKGRVWRYGRQPSSNLASSSQFLNEAQSGLGFTAVWRAASDEREGLPFSVVSLKEDGTVDFKRIIDVLNITRAQLAQTVGLKAESLQKNDRSKGKKVQVRIREMTEIISRITDWAGSEAQAFAWYRSQPIPALDGRTAEALVQEGRATEVRKYLDHMAVGGFA